MTVGQWVLAGALVAVIGVGAWRAWADGRFRGTHRVRGADPLSGLDRDARPDARPGEPRPAAEGADPAPRGQGGLLAGTPYAERLGARATLLQFSSAFCAPCRATRHTLAAVADEQPGVAHVDVDAEHHLDLVRRVGVLRTPTTLVLDADGREVVRATGAPRREQVLAALARLWRRNAE